MALICKHWFQHSAISEEFKIGAAQRKSMRLVVNSMMTQACYSYPIHFLRNEYKLSYYYSATERELHVCISHDPQLCTVKMPDQK